MMIKESSCCWWFKIFFSRRTISRLKEVNEKTDLPVGKCFESLLCFGLWHPFDHLQDQWTVNETHSFIHSFRDVIVVHMRGIESKCEQTESPEKREKREFIAWVHFQVRKGLSSISCMYSRWSSSSASLSAWWSSSLNRENEKEVIQTHSKFPRICSSYREC